MNKGFKEWISTDIRIGYITNFFGRILYINDNWPNGSYTRWDGKKRIKFNKLGYYKGRSFNDMELILELL